MHVIVFGLNHKTASVDVRERVFFADTRLGQAYKTLSGDPLISGCVIVSTCNRIEIYCSVESIEEGFAHLEAFIAQFHGVPIEEILPYSYRKHCQEAVSHLYRVTSSLDSLVVGEYQIQGQIRDAYTFASTHGYTNGLINKLFQTAIQAGKIIRSETEIGKGSVSVASVAVTMVMQLLQGAENLNILLVGAGKIASLTAANLTTQQPCSIKIANRSMDKAFELADRFKATVIDFKDRHLMLAESDVIIVSTGATEYTIQREKLEKALKTAEVKKRFFIDLSMPRNIDPSISEIDNVYLYSIDDLQNVIYSTMHNRSKEVEKAEKIITEVSDDYFEWYTKQTIIPVMKELKKELAIIKERALLSNKAALCHFDECQQIAIREMLDIYSDKLIKVIMKNLKNVTKTDDMLSIAQSLKNSFTIDDKDL